MYIYYFKMSNLKDYIAHAQLYKDTYYYKNVSMKYRFLSQKIHNINL